MSLETEVEICLFLTQNETCFPSRGLRARSAVGVPCCEALFFSIQSRLHASELLN